jgi:hypothetical protein
MAPTDANEPGSRAPRQLAKVGLRQANDGRGNDLQGADNRPRNCGLRLVQSRCVSRVAELVDGVEEAFSVCHALLLERLAELEAGIDAAVPRATAGAPEQIAFVRVGLRCIADAIGELAALAEDVERAVGTEQEPAG